MMKEKGVFLQIWKVALFHSMTKGDEAMEQEKLKKVVEAAKLYYLLDYNQNDIAKKLGVSRPTVSRLLQQAKEEGIVEIKINDPAEDIQQLAKQLEQKFNLKKSNCCVGP